MISNLDEKLDFFIIFHIATSSRPFGAGQYSWYQGTSTARDLSIAQVFCDIISSQTSQEYTRDIAIVKHYCCQRYSKFKLMTFSDLLPGNKLYKVSISFCFQILFKT